MSDRFGLDSSIITPYSPLAGMGFVPRMTEREVVDLARARTKKIYDDLLIPPITNITLPQEEILYISKYGEFSDPSRYLTNNYPLEVFAKNLKSYRRRAEQELGTDAPYAVLNKYAGSLKSIDLGQKNFDRYKNFTTKYLTLIKNLTANGVMESASTFIQSRVECFPLEIPFFGQLSIYDIKLDNMSSMNNLIDTVKNTNWTDVSRQAIATFSKDGGIADYGAKALDTAVDIATSIATLSSTIGAVGFSAGIGTVIATIVPWILLAIAIIAIAEALYGWLSGNDDEDKQEELYERATAEGDALIAGISDLLLLSLTDTNAVKATINLRLAELSAYGSNVRETLWAGCEAITRSDETPARYTGDPSAVRSNGTTNTLVPIRAFSNQGLRKKKVMLCKVEYLKSIHQYLSGIPEIGDRRLAFEMLGMTTLPNSVAFSRGLWTSDSYTRNPLKLYKPPALSKAAQAAIQAAQPTRAAAMAEADAMFRARKAAYDKANAIPVLPKYVSLSKPTAKTLTTEKKSVAPLLIGAAAASAVYVYYNR